MSIKTSSLILASCCLLALASCTGTTTTDSSSAPASVDQATSATSQDSAAPSQETPAPSPSAPLGEDLTQAGLTAIATAEAQAGGRAYAIDDLDSDGAWEVDVLEDGISTEYKISADGTTVLTTEHDDDANDDADERAALQGATVTLAQAITTAVLEGGAPLDDAELDNESGTWAWEVSLQGRSKDIIIDLNTGAVLSS